MALPKVFQAHPVVEACLRTERESFENIHEESQAENVNKGGSVSLGCSFQNDVGGWLFLEPLTVPETPYDRS